MTTVISAKTKKIIILDILLLSIIYFIPTLSHLIGFPLYLLDPMRIVVLSSLLILGNKKNAYILAFTIPLFSFMVSGHPVFPKNLLITIELIANLFLFLTINKNVGYTFISMFLSIILSKLFYYGLKYLIVLLGLLEMDIVSTPILIQLVVALSISILFSIFYSKNKI
ncbi:MAG: hypothetical protein WBH98_06490 [Bacteroidales bacterium]